MKKTYLSLLVCILVFFSSCDSQLSIRKITYNYIDKMGNIVISKNFSVDNSKLFNFDFKEDFAGFNSGNKFGFIDKKGDKIIKAQF